MVVGAAMSGNDAELNSYPCDLNRTLLMLMGSSENGCRAPCTPRFAKKPLPCVQWLGPEIKLKNTFVTMDLSNNEEESMYQASRRRLVKSCQFSVDSGKYSLSSSLIALEGDVLYVDPLGHMRSSTQEAELCERVSPSAAHADSTGLTNCLNANLVDGQDGSMSSQATAVEEAQRHCDAAVQSMWPKMKVKNTFITLDVFDDEDEIMLHQAAERRAVKTCSCHMSFPDQASSSSSRLGAGDSNDNVRNDAEQSFELPTHKRTSTLELQLLQHLLEKEAVASPAQKLVLTSIGFDDLSCNLDFMIDEPTPTAFATGRCEPDRARNEGHASDSYPGLAADASSEDVVSKIHSCLDDEGSSTKLQKCEVASSRSQEHSIVEGRRHKESRVRSSPIVRVATALHELGEINRKSSKPSCSLSGLADAKADRSDLPLPLRWPTCCRYSSDVRKHCASPSTGAADEMPAPLRWPSCSRFSDKVRKEISECISR